MVARDQIIAPVRRLGESLPFALSPSKPVLNGASGEVLPPFDRRPTGNREFV